MKKKIQKKISLGQEETKKINPPCNIDRER